MSVDGIRSDESLGRRVSEKGAPPRQYSRIRKNLRMFGGEQEKRETAVPYQVFIPKAGETALSVDRMDKAPREEAAAIAERDAAIDGRIFYGWAVVLYRNAAQSGRLVRASPIQCPPNPFHADIVFPDAAKYNKDERKAHAQKLAENAKWLEWREREKSRPNFRVV